ncbi:MAG TPA: metallophosphoesterase [Vicinamibacterales bacterium]|nr:metallophosphoesterase [Vicinamibacterales bacterium]
MPRVLDQIASGQRAQVTMLAAVTAGLALLALLTPFGPAEFPAARVGILLGFAAAIELVHGLRRSTAAARRQATSGAVISMAIALLLINAPFVAAAAMRVLVAGWFAIDAGRNAIAILRRHDRHERRLAALAALGNAAVVVLLLFAGGWTMTWLIAIAGALRMLGIAWNIMLAPVHSTTDADEAVISELGLEGDPQAAGIAADIEAAERARAPIDRGWIIAFVGTLFAIHIGRMQVDLTILGLISPAVAVLGDMAIAVLVVLLGINPLYLLWRGPTRWVERRAWRWYLPRLASAPPPLGARVAGAWLRWRLRYAIRMRAARYSVPAVLKQSLQTGLPVAAILAATVPVWGMSWYFDTENWAAGMWNSWAASRTDPWREAMVHAVLAREGGTPAATTFAVTPPGIDAGDFSFVVIGDTGEGDASQHVLRDQLLSVANGADVRFVAIASDVVYPTGAMKDYEAKFWLPFKGVTKPVYAIPGNHDWYDALEGFLATFLQPDAARASIRARAESDLRVGSTTDQRIETLVSEADRLRRIYGVQTGFQRAPFFEVQSDRFALIAIDTGVLKTIDAAQSAWLDAALDRAAGKMTMAIVGHPFFAGGHDVTAETPAFASVRQRLRRRGVSIVMAGDTHDLEYYREPGAGGAPDIHHFVNGGGGAYLSFGTALDWPASVPVAEWAHYPDRDAVTEKIQSMTPWWKRPAWWWTTWFGAWPFTPEWLSAAFDYNAAPFFQSFVEVKVEPSRNRVRLIPYGVNGRLTWRDLAASDPLRVRAGVADDRALVEWVVPMAPRPAP